MFGHCFISVVSSWSSDRSFVSSRAVVFFVFHFNYQFKALCFVVFFVTKVNSFLFPAPRVSSAFESCLHCHVTEVAVFCCNCLFFFCLIFQKFIFRIILYFKRRAFNSLPAFQCKTNKTLPTALIGCFLSAF